MTHHRKIRFLLVGVALLAAILGCNLFGTDEAGDEGAEPSAPDPTAIEEVQFPLEPMEIDEPGGASLQVDTGALSEEAEVMIAEIGEGVPFAAGSPLTIASAEYEVDLGGADQVGEITMTVPLNGSTKVSAADSPMTYLTWSEPEEGHPSVVGAIVEDGQATFPLIGSGKYQVHGLVSHEALRQLVSVFEPLAVPTYPQRTPAWCSPTAMTNLVQYHQGGWPVGGLGHVWGESSNWYLAGKAGQAYNTGYFFHWLLGAGGYTVPSNVKESFSNGNVEVIIWNWRALVNSGFSNPAFANFLFNAFHSYVESFVWGMNGDRRPVAWGSSLDAHSRTITGSNGTELYYNDPGSGSHNQSRSWADYRQMVLDSLSAEKIEVIDTVVFHAAPRPAVERRGVTWLLPRKTDGFPGSIALIDGETGQPATNWHWDGSMSRVNGYYHEDLRGVLPTDPIFDSQFKALHYLDEVEFGFSVFNISTQPFDFTVHVSLNNESSSVLETIGSYDMTVQPGTRENFFPMDSFRIVDLPPELYTLKFTLMQNGIFQDAKYVQFPLAQTELLMIEPFGILTQNAFCRAGPDPVFRELTAYEKDTELKLIGFNPEHTWGYFEKLINDIQVRCWISLTAVELTGGEFAPVVPVPALPTEEPEGPVCVATLDREACNAAGGVYTPVPGAAPYCQCP